MLQIDKDPIISTCTIIAIFFYVLATILFLLYITNPNNPDYPPGLAVGSSLLYAFTTPISIICLMLYYNE